MIFLRLIAAGFLFVLAVLFALLFVVISIPLLNDLFVLRRDIPQPIYMRATYTPHPIPIFATIPATMPPPMLLPTMAPALLQPTATPVLLPVQELPIPCDPAYPTICIEPMTENLLNCSDIPQFRNFIVLAPDPQKFDRNGDGVGCEE